MKVSDEDLVARAKLGDQDAFTALYKRHMSRVKYVVGRMLRDCPDDVEDVALDTMAKAFRYIGGFQGDSKFATWIHRIAIREALMLRRTRSNLRNRALVNAIPLEYEGDDGKIVQQDIPETEKGFAQIEARIDTARILPNLAPGYRAMIELRYLSELSYEEISDSMGVSTGTAKSHTVKGLRKAKQIMEGIENQSAVNKPEAGTNCGPCEDADRFRYADVFGPAGVPMCRWCAGEAKNSTTNQGASDLSSDKKATKKARICACGCGTTFVPTGNRQMFIPGHNPHKPMSAAPAKRRGRPASYGVKSTAVAVTQNLPEVETVNIKIPVAFLDKIWMSRTAEQKARAAEMLMSMV